MEENHYLTNKVMEIMPARYVESAGTKADVAKMVAIMRSEKVDITSKYVTIKMVEYLCKQYLEEEKDAVKKKFVKEFNGATNVDAYGVNFQLRKKKNATEITGEYLFSKEVTDMEDELKQLQEDVESLKEAIAIRKHIEINQDTAIVISEGNELDNYSLVVTLRKE